MKHHLTETHKHNFEIQNIVLPSQNIYCRSMDSHCRNNLSVCVLSLMISLEVGMLHMYILLHNPDHGSYEIGYILQVTHYRTSYILHVTRYILHVTYYTIHITYFTVNVTE